MSGFTSEQLDALENPQRRKRARVGVASKDNTQTERQIQRAIIAALGAVRIRTVHIPNGAHLAGDDARRMRQMAALRKDGLRPGFPDLLLWRPLTGAAPLVGCMEIKRPGGELNANQEAWRDALTADAMPWAAVCSVEMALDAVREWGWIK